ncbi:MAG: LamG-like jellyroll fold domain-containing protein [Kiritimatiellia bacterium]
MKKTPVSTVRAGFGKALHFDGIDDYAVVEGTNSIWFTGTDTYTITLWARPETNGWLYRLDGVVGAYRDYISLDADGRVTFAVAKGGSRADEATSPDPIPWGRWSHIAGVRDATNITLYINGRACATQALKEITLSAPLSEANLYFGVKPVSLMEQHFGGALDEICLFREVLPGPAIDAWAFRRPDHSHPAYSKLVVQFDCDVVSNDATPNAVDEEMTANLHNMPGEAQMASLLPTDYSVVNTSSSGQLVGHDLLGSSDTGLDWNMTFQVVSNGTLGTVSVVDSHHFLFTPFSNTTGTNRFAYRCVNVDGTTSDVTTAQIVIPADFDGDGVNDIWEQVHGLSPTNHLDADENWDGDSYNNRQEFIADTDPDDPDSYFCIMSVSKNPQPVVTFQSSSERLYSLFGCSNLLDGNWRAIPGGGPRMGTGGLDALSDTNNPPSGQFYRLLVELPSP